MTDLEKRAKEYANNWLEEVHKLEWQHKTDPKPEYIRIQQAYKDGATKETTLLSQHILDLQKDKGNLTDRVKELEQQIEKMKCCGNCRFSESDKLNGTFCHREGCFVVASAKCKLWEN